MIGYYKLNTLICILPISFFAWTRRNPPSPEAAALGISGSFILLYGFSNLWSFQYLAWSLPFWFLLSRRFAIPALLLSTGYVYGLYAWLCGHPLLLAPWDFIGNPQWPSILLFLRSVTYLFFLGSAFYLMLTAVRQEWAYWQAKFRLG